MTRKEFTCATALFSGLFLAGSVLAAGPSKHTLYSFQGGNDGISPSSSMIADKAGNLYGATSGGGGSPNCPGGCGTIFELSPPASTAGAWTEAVLYRFQGGDGAYPQAPLIMDESGNLYGTTASGGAGDCSPQGSVGCGVVFELVHPTAAAGPWSEIVLYNFQGVPRGRGYGDLAGPNGLAFDQAGNLFGLAYSGGFCRTDETGRYCYGGAYGLKRPAAAASAWEEQVIYIFHGPTGAPAGPIFGRDGSLFGTVVWGKYGFGEVFRLTPPDAAGKTWTRIPVFDFNGSDGAFPEPGLAFNKAGDLFGATLGSPAGSPYGDVYELRPTSNGEWSESLAYDFTPYQNGNSPNGSPIMGRAGELYGTAAAGGAFGAGVVFVLTPSSPAGGGWGYQVLYNFSGGADGAPSYGLTFGLGRVLYGTTTTGGDLSCGSGAGCGTVFQVIP